jgi:hypothetical protein
MFGVEQKYIGHKGSKAQSSEGSCHGCHSCRSRNLPAGTVVIVVMKAAGGKHWPQKPPIKNGHKDTKAQRNKSGFPSAAPTGLPHGGMTFLSVPRGCAWGAGLLS